MQIFILLTLLLHLYYGSVMLYTAIQKELPEVQFATLLNVIIGLIAVAIHIKVNML